MQDKKASKIADCMKKNRIKFKFPQTPQILNPRS